MGAPDESLRGHQARDRAVPLWPTSSPTGWRRLPFASSTSTGPVSGPVTCTPPSSLCSSTLCSRGAADGQWRRHPLARLHLRRDGLPRAPGRGPAPGGHPEPVNLAFGTNTTLLELTEDDRGVSRPVRSTWSTANRGPATSRTPRRTTRPCVGLFPEVSRCRSSRGSARRSTGSRRARDAVVVDRTGLRWAAHGVAGDGEAGYRVIGLDPKESVVAGLNAGRLAHRRRLRRRASSRSGRGLPRDDRRGLHRRGRRRRGMCPTPLAADGGPDLGPVEGAARTIGEQMPRTRS